MFLIIHETVFQKFHVQLVSLKCYTTFSFIYKLNLILFFVMIFLYSMLDC